MIDISTLSRPYNITIDTKYCVGSDVLREDLVLRVIYTGEVPTFETIDGTPYNMTVDTMGLCMRSFYFLTEEEYFLESI